MSSRVLAFLTCIALCVMVACGCAADSEETTDDGSSAVWNGPNRFGLELATLRDLDLGNSYWLARISSMAYGSRAEIARDLAAVGVQDAELIFFENGATGTQAVYIGLPDVGILAFRGTSSIKDWLIDAVAIRRKTRLGDVHTGFDTALLSVWNDAPGVTANGRRGEGIAKHLRRRHWRASADPELRPKPLLLTGHSLGGALASLASVYAHWDTCLREKPASDPFWEGRLRNLALDAPCEDRNIEVTALHTFGAPRVGGAHHASMTFFAAEYAHAYRTSLFRFVNSNDLVTSVPDEGYIHTAWSRNERDGIVYLTKEGAADHGGKSSEYLRWGWRTRVFDRIGDHEIDRYARKLLRYAGQVPPPPRLSPARARNERLKAAYLAPGDPPLARVTRDGLPNAALKSSFDAPATNQGTKQAFVWAFEGANLYVFDERYEQPVERADGTRYVRPGRSVHFFDAAGSRLLSGTYYADDRDEVGMSWYDWNDSSSSR